MYPQRMFYSINKKKTTFFLITNSYLEYWLKHMEIMAETHIQVMAGR